MYGILIVEQDWADEFDVFGFFLLTEEQNKKYKIFKEKYPEFFNKKRDWYFGSNQVYHYFCFKDIEHKDITKDEYDTLKRVLDIKYSDIGLFPDITDHINDYLYSINKEDTSLYI